ncbi:MAG: glycosyltransferase family 4 protein [Kouleothrix sp.]|nr:glycosyltransferase family 4 protein [Kouleothrix sp.]
MKILMLSKALVVGAYQKKAEELAALPGVELTVAAPPSWREPGAVEQRLERRFTRGYRLVELPIWFNGRHHAHCYPAIDRLVAATRPDVFHVDEESFNLATFQAIRAGVRHSARCCFYSWANIERRYPPPFGWFERYAFRHAAHAIAGNCEAGDIIRGHGYAGPITVLPQFGVDPDLFAPAADAPTSQRSNAQTFVVGYLGRLVAQKGVLDLVEALPLLPESVRLRLIGDGVLRERIFARAAELGVRGRVEQVEWTDDVPGELRRLDALALPSRTTRSWKEQFGRVLPEAMSCGVPVIGSSSGEIPNVIGDAGLVYPEGDLAALAAAIVRLAGDPSLWADLRRRGRARVLAQYTQAALARQYYEVYRSML